MSTPKIETVMRLAFADALMVSLMRPGTGTGKTETAIYSAIKRNVGRTERRQWWSVQRGRR